MRLIDEQYMKTPFYGSPRMTEVLKRKGYQVNHKRIERLMQVVGIAAIYPKKHTRQPQPLNRIYPYLLDHLEISRPDQVWASDITYIRLAHGFVFLTAFMDWFSRYVLAWEFSILLDKEFCLTALDRALGISRPGVRQCLHRAALADGEVRGSLSSCLRNGGRSASASGELLHFLQHGAAAFIARLSNAPGRIFRRIDSCVSAILDRAESLR
jgi:putative transposase